MTLNGQNEEIKKNVLRMPLRVTEYARRFTQGHWSFLWYGTHAHKPDGEWDTTAEGMMLNPVFRASSALERGELKSKGKGVKRTVVDETIESIHRTIISVNQFSIYGAVADLSKALARDSSSAGKPAAN